jgi:hypothetical protein
MAIFARAFLYCHEHDVDFDVMAAKLGSIDYAYGHAARRRRP